MKNTKISIIIATYNAFSTLQKCLNSIYKQSYPNTEVIVIDGASTDGTIEILEDNSHRLAYWCSEPDSGIYNAMNKGVKYAKGEWLFFLGADDELHEGFSLMANLLQNSSSIYYGNVLYKGIKRAGEIQPYTFAKQGIHHQAIFYPRLVFQKYTYDERYKIGADYVLNLRCYTDKQLSFIYNDFVIATYNHTGVSANTSDVLLEEHKADLVRKHFSFFVWLRYLVKVGKTRLKTPASR